MKEQINNLLKTIGLKAEEIVLATETLDNGAATLEAETFEAGQPVFIVNEDERIPLPVGEYQLDSGMVLVVAEEGVISEMKEKATEEEEPVAEEEEVAANDTATEQPLPKSIIESVTKETKFSAEEALVETMKEEITALKAELAELKAETPEPVEETTEEVKEEVEEVELKKINHNPENSKPIDVFKYAQSSGQSRLDRIYSKLNS